MRAQRSNVPIILLTALKEDVDRIIGLEIGADDYLGKPFNSDRLASLQQEMDEYLHGEGIAGMHQGAKADLSYTRAERILGRLNILLQMVPPFSIELMTFNTSLAADESAWTINDAFLKIKLGVVEYLHAAPSRIGGLLKMRRYVEMAQAANVGCVYSIYNSPALEYAISSHFAFSATPKKFA